MENEFNLKDLLDVNKIRLLPLKVKFDITTLDMVIAFIYKKSVLRTRKVCLNMYKLFTNLDESRYEKQKHSEENIEALKTRIWIIRTSLFARLFEGWEDEQRIAQYCKDQIDCTEYAKDILDIIDSYTISHEESKYLIRKLDDTLQYGYIITIKDYFKLILNKIDEDDFKTYKAVQDNLFKLANILMNIKRNSASIGSEHTFSLYQDQFDNIIDECVQILQDRNRVFTTGIQRFNNILAPGFISKRLYLFLAFPGKGKSTMLLKSALDIRKYNKGVKTKDPDKRPAVLFLTLENDIPETVERIYNMTVSSDDIRNYKSKQVIKQLKNNGLALTDDDNIDIIIKEYKNREIDTNDIYNIINDLADDGVEVITVIIDYIKRIRPFEKANDEKTELKNISNELKELAKFYDIPVITAQQLNRSGAAVIDAAIQAKKEDVTRLVGRDSIASAWELLENSDWVCIINPETKMDTGELFMTFKLLKRRYRSVEDDDKIRRLDYFNHPFEIGSEIKLIDDVNLPKPLSLESLATQFEPVEYNRGKENVVERESTNKKKKKKTDMDLFEDSPFNSSVAVNY